MALEPARGTVAPRSGPDEPTPPPSYDAPLGWVRELDRGAGTPPSSLRGFALALEPSPLVPTWVVLPAAAVVAAVLGVAVGIDAPLAATAILGAAALVLLLGRLEVAVALLVVASVFTHYLSSAAPGLVPGIALVTFGAWAIRRTHGRLHPGRRSPVLVAALVLGLAVLLATLVNLDEATATAGEVWLGVLSVCLVTADALRARLSVETLARAYVAAAALAALCGLAADLLPDDVRVSAPFAQPAELALVLVSALPLALSLRGLTARPWVWDLCSLVLVLGLAVTAPLVGLGAGVAALVFAVLTRQLTRASLTGLVGASLAAAGALASLAGPDLLRRLHDDVVRSRQALGLPHPWAAVRRALQVDPVFGLGPGAATNHHSLYDDRLQVATGLYGARSTYPAVLVELGVLGLVALVALVVVAVWAAATSWRRDRTPIAAGVASALVATAAAGVVAGAQLELPLWLLVAMATALGARSARSARITDVDVVLPRNPDRRLGRGYR